MEEIRSSARFFCVFEPRKADSDGLIECLSNALHSMGIEDILDMQDVLGAKGKHHPILVGMGTDGVSVNVSEQNGMRGKVQKALPWVFWAWCYNHRLELACHDALFSSLFIDINEMLLRLYYLYEKSPKKCRELSDVVTDLKEVFDFPDGGNLPVRAHGTRWISHKRKALQRVIDRYGAYLSHLQALTEDTTIRSVDRQRLKGYLLKWKEGRILIGCALYIDILQSPSLLSLSLQDDCIDVASGIKNLLKSHRSLKKLSSQEPLKWPSVASVYSKVKRDINGSSSYQGVVLRRYNDSTISSCKTQALADLHHLDERMRCRLEWSDMHLLRSILLVLDTQSWQSQESEHANDVTELDEDDTLVEIKEAVGTISEHFRAPLEAYEVDLSSILDETEDAVLYARRYLNIQKESYKRIWFLLHNLPDATSWPNLLLMCELLFSLPFSTAKVERLFSMLKVIKTEKRTNLNISSMNDVMEINTEGPSLGNFTADPAIELWWKDCSTTRRVEQRPRKKYRKRKVDKSDKSNEDSSSAAEEEEVLALQSWDNWLAGDDLVDGSDCGDDEMSVIPEVESDSRESVS